MTKSELRKQFLAKQRGLAPGLRRELSRAIAARFFWSFYLSDVKVLHIFISIEKFGEVDTGEILSVLGREHPQITIVVTRVNFSAGEMENLKFDPDGPLAENAWGIFEPSHDEFVSTDAIDIVLVPGLAFDERGHRVGYGKGFYDRFLKKCRPDCVKAGLSYFAPVEEITDTHPGDVSLDHIIMPDAVRDIAPRADSSI